MSATAEQPDWFELPTRELVKEKLPCGCWNYFQQGRDYAVYTLIVQHSCNADHKLSVAASTSPPEPGEPIRIARQITETEVETPIHTPETPQLGGVRNN